MSRFPVFIISTFLPEQIFETFLNFSSSDSESEQIDSLSWFFTSPGGIQNLIAIEATLPPLEEILTPQQGSTVVSFLHEDISGIERVQSAGLMFGDFYAAEILQGTSRTHRERKRSASETSSISNDRAKILRVNSSSSEDEESVLIASNSIDENLNSPALSPETNQDHTLRSPISESDRTYTILVPDSPEKHQIINLGPDTPIPESPIPAIIIRNTKNNDKNNLDVENDRDFVDEEQPSNSRLQQEIPIIVITDSDNSEPRETSSCGNAPVEVRQRSEEQQQIPNTGGEVRKSIRLSRSKNRKWNGDRGRTCHICLQDVFETGCFCKARRKG